MPDEAKPAETGEAKPQGGTAEEAASPKMAASPQPGQALEEAAKAATAAPTEEPQGPKPAAGKPKAKVRLADLDPEDRATLELIVERTADKAIQGYRQKLIERGLLADDGSAAPSKPGPSGEEGHDEDVPLTVGEYLRREQQKLRENKVIQTLRSVIQEYGWNEQQQQKLLAFLNDEEKKGEEATFSRRDLLTRPGILAAARAAGLFEPPETILGPGGPIIPEAQYGTLPKGYHLDSDGRVVKGLESSTPPEGVSVEEMTRRRVLERIHRAATGRT